MLRRLGQARPELSVDELEDLVDIARSTRTAAELIARGGVEVGGLWEELRALDDAARTALGAWLAVEGRSARRMSRSNLAAVAGLATALRSGRAARRDQLNRLNDDKLTDALPLWVGTLADVDDLLPVIPALFDLVILDEASSIDQVLAAPALLRGARTVVAGDPHQLRHVSFLADDQLRAVLAGHELDASPTLAALLDVRRNSIFDVAAGAAPVVVLDEHFRSRPHLVDFVAHRLYDGRVRVATRSPSTQSTVCIEVIRCHGRRDEAGVVGAEVDEAMTEVRKLLAAGASSVGVVTPFRAQADAIEAAALEGLSVDEIEALDLRVGTVHAFQGNERDIVIASFGVGPDDGGTTWRFVEDPHLFAVFVTRARQRLVVLVSADPPKGGLVDEYLIQARMPPGPPKSLGPVSDWSAAIAAELSSAGLAVTTSYPTGRHAVDICLNDPVRSVGIECDVHPDGAEAHIQRHLDLRRAGWDLLEAYRSRWMGRRAELVVRLVNDLRPSR